MPLDTVDKGQVEKETEEMRKAREEMVAKSPPPQIFKLRAELLKQGRSNQTVADTGNMWVNLKVYASGGENGLHNHTNQDHFHLVRCRCPDLDGALPGCDRATRIRQL